MPAIIRVGGGGVDVSDATATVDKVLTGYTFYAGEDDEKKTGTYNPNIIVTGTVQEGATVDTGIDYDIAIVGGSIISGWFYRDPLGNVEDAGTMFKFDGTNIAASNHSNTGQYYDFVAIKLGGV